MIWQPFFSLPFSFFLFFIVPGTVAGCAAHMLSSWAAQSAGKVPTTWFLGGVNTQFSPSRKSLPASAAVRRSGTRRSGDVQPRSVLSEAQTDACSRLAYGRRGGSPSGVHEGANLVHTSRNTALQAARASEGAAVRNEAAVGRRGRSNEVTGNTRHIPGAQS